MIAHELEGRPVAGGRQLVHVQGPVAELRELEGGGGADDAGANDEGVVLVAHDFSPCPEREW